MGLLEIPQEVKLQLITLIKMRNFIKLKLATIIAFLLIVFPGKLAVINAISIPSFLLIYLSELLYPEGDFMKM
jgi:hypothetical protein